MSNMFKHSLPFLRTRLGIKKFPIGFDLNGNWYFDDGLIRRVVAQRSSSSSSSSSSLKAFHIAIVPYQYSKWLNYEIDEFPDESTLENVPRFYFDKVSEQDRTSFRLGEKELEREKAVYKPSFDTFLVIRFGYKPALF